MTIKKFGISALLILSLSLCLIGCGDNNDNSFTRNWGNLQKNENNYITGKYILHTLIDHNGNSYTPEEIGYTHEISIRLYEDGTAVMTGKGPTTDMIYTDSKIWAVDEPDDKVDFSANGNTVRIEAKDATLIFKK